jgi:cytochrome c5
MQSFSLIMGGLVLFAIVIFIVANSITGENLDASKLSPVTKKAIEERIAPVGRVAIEGRDEPPPAVAAAPAVVSEGPKSGAEVVTAICAACHATGAAGAPKIGSSEEWTPRLDKGYDALVQSAINGLNAMPARGGDPNLSDEEIRGAVMYMLTETGLQVEGAPVTEAPAPATQPPAPSQEPNVAGAAKQPAQAAAAQGQKVYTQVCVACHGTGAAGAPKLGDETAWEARIAQGMDLLHQHAIEGYQGSSGVMPAKGGRADLSDEQVMSAVTYMIEQSE